MIDYAQMLELKRWNTPTIYNGWEQITHHDHGRDAFNLDTVTDFMPQMGPMVGRAITLVIQQGNREHAKQNPPDALMQYLRYVASQPGPKIAVVRDLDSPDRITASAWGEIFANAHRTLGCVGTITDGAVRDVDEMTNAGFKALARRLCVGHGYGGLVEWNVPVEVFGRTVNPGELIHADKHGFMAIPADDEDQLLEAARFMDHNECANLLPVVRGVQGKSNDQVLDDFEKAFAQFRQTIKDKFARKGEW